MPLLPASLIEPLWVELAALTGSDERPEFVPTHPWGCHRRRLPDRVVFEHLIGAFVHGSGYERIATPGCSDRTIRRRLGRVGRRRARTRAAADLPDRLRPDHRPGPLVFRSFGWSRASGAQAASTARVSCGWPAQGLGC